MSLIILCTEKNLVFEVVCSEKYRHFIVNIMKNVIKLHRMAYIKTIINSTLNLFSCHFHHLSKSVQKTKNVIQINAHCIVYLLLFVVCKTRRISSRLSHRSCRVTVCRQCGLSGDRTSPLDPEQTH